VRNRLRLALLALGTLVISAAAAPASAQGWPTRPVTVVVPFAAGSSTDTAARILAVGMSEVLGQQLVIENVGGAAGMTGTLRVARSAPDGYQMLFGTVDTLAIAPACPNRAFLPWRFSYAGPRCAPRRL
jgi:tripartite-type tricarboxylate transporter receptor subunit TctC